MEWLLALSYICGGVALCLLLQVGLLLWFVWGAPPGCPPPDGPPPPCRLPPSLGNMDMYTENGDCAAALSLALQFLFQELKHTPAPLAWLHRKLHQELLDLLTRTTSGKLFESLTVRSISLGNSAPRIRWAGVQNVETTNEGRLKTVDLLIDVFYSGGFRLAVDAGILLGKTACMDIEVEQLSGRARVRFTRDPYTHWSLSFLNPPKLELCARPLKARLSTLIQAHARRVLHKKHTLPNFTIRYKPFFKKNDPSQLDVSSEENQSCVNCEGTFEMALLEITRLSTDFWKAKQEIYCTVSLDSSPWISFREEKDCYAFTLDIVVHKDRTQQLGTVFKQATESVGTKTKSFVVVETVMPLSAAYRADLRRDDIILSVNNKTITNLNQIPKVVKSISHPYFTVRVERKMKKHPVQPVFSLLVSDDDTKVEKQQQQQEKSNLFSFRKMSEVMESAKNVGLEGRAMLKAAGGGGSSSSTTLTDTETKSEKPTNATTESFGLRKRRCSVENKTSSDSSTGSTPNTSCPGTPSKRANKSSKEDAHKKSDMSSETPMQNDELIQSHTTAPLPYSDVIVVNETMTFKLNKNHRFINVNVWGKNNNGAEDVLLAYLNIPLITVLSQCNGSSRISQHTKVFTLLPPDVDLTASSKIHPLASHSGFEPCLCYGDILLSFSWTNPESEQNKAASKASKEVVTSDSEYVEEYSDSPREEPSAKTKPVPTDDVPWKSHNFIRTHFHKSTQCDYCGKKIWLKDAVQCRDCALCCHKKCLNKCLSSERCQPPSILLKDDSFSSSQDTFGNEVSQTPEFLMTEHLDNSCSTSNLLLLSHDVMDQQFNGSLLLKSDEGSLGRNALSGLLGGLRRVGSAHCLSPTSFAISQVRSLPPSPHHSPSRCQSLDDDMAWAALGVTVSEGVTNPIELLKPLIAAQISSDILLSKAKHTGPNLLAHLPQNIRAEKISYLISEVKTCLNEENEKLNEAQKKMSSKNLVEDELAKQKRVFAKCEEQTQALTALLLHCCAAMQSIKLEEA